MAAVSTRGILVIVVAMSASSGIRAEELGESAKPRVHLSPQSVFDAYRDVCNKRAWRAAYACMTPKAKVFAVYESWYACLLSDRDPKVVAILDRFELKSDTIDEDYARRYQKKYGIDPRTPIATAGHGSEKVATVIIGPKGELTPGETVAPKPLPPLDQELFAQAVYAETKDGAGFYEAVQRVMNREDSERIERIDGVRVQGDTATGRVTLSTFITMISSKPGGLTTTTKTPTSRVQEFQFRKSGGTWLLDANH
jgi:hypothetical protein